MGHLRAENCMPILPAFMRVKRCPPLRPFIALKSEYVAKFVAESISFLRQARSTASSGSCLRWQFRYLTMLDRKTFQLLEWATVLSFEVRPEFLAPTHYYLMGDSGFQASFKSFDLSIFPGKLTTAKWGVTVILSFISDKLLYSFRSLLFLCLISWSATSASSFDVCIGRSGAFQ